MQKMEPLDTYSDGQALSTFGQQKYRLFADRIVISGNRSGQTFDSTVPLSDLRIEPTHLRLHGQMFRLGFTLAVVTSFLLVVTCIIFRDIQKQFVLWYSAGAILVVVGILGCVASFRKIRVTRFVGEATGNALVDVISQSRVNRKKHEAFASAIQRQIAACRHPSRESKP